MDKDYHEVEFLGERYPLPQIGANSPTKEQILLNATLLFAKRGYASVSMRDLADAIGIKPASLYNHFDSKEMLWIEVLEHAKNLYLLYFKELDDALEEAGTFHEVLDIMFLEPRRLANIFTCYAFSMIQAEQFRDEQAGAVFSDVLLKYSVDFISGWLQKCVDKGLAPAFDTRIVAMLFMHSVLIGLNIKVQECMGRGIPYDPAKMFTDLQRFITETVLGKDGAAPESTAEDE